MADDNPVVSAMAAVTLADKMSFYSARLEYVLVNIARLFHLGALHGVRPTSLWSVAVMLRGNHQRQSECVLLLSHMYNCACV